MKKNLEITIIEDAGDKLTLEICQMYQDIGFDCIWNDGKDLILKEKDLPSSSLKSPTVPKSTR